MKKEITTDKDWALKNGQSRREFILNSATYATGAAAFSMLPASILKALSIQANKVTGTIKDVQHVVILMQGSRSFDHYFGTMKGVRGFSDRFPIPMETGKPVWFQRDGEREITPFHLDNNTMNAIAAPGISGKVDSTQAAWNQGKYGSWPKFKLSDLGDPKSGLSMGYYTRKEIPFQFALAEAFTLCDNYFCSVMGAASPNRVQFFSGSNFDPAMLAQGKNQGPGTAEMAGLRTYVFDKLPEPGYKYLGNAFEWPTIPEVLEQAGISWRIYQNPNDNFEGSMNGCLAFKNFREAKKGSPVYENGMSNWSLDNLLNDVKTGTLPQVSWILPSKAESENGTGSSVASGADFTNRVLNALTSNPDTWSKTVLFVTYDGSDGHFDHVPPPAVPSFNPDGSLAGASTLDISGMYFDATGANEFTDLVALEYLKKAKQPVPAEAGHAYYINPEDTTSNLVRPMGMGPRVPMYVISPWSKGGWVSSEVFDHTSVAQFLEKRFDIVVPAIAPWNRAVSGDLTSAFDFAHPDSQPFPLMPVTANYKELEAAQQKLPPASAPKKSLPFKQEMGSRPSRPTPYSRHVLSKVENGRLVLQFVNDGKKGVVFHVYDKLHLDRIPRRYVVEAGKTLKDAGWDPAENNDDYHLEVHSTNGFFRSLKGNTRDTISLEVRLEYDSERKSIFTEIYNAGPGSVGVSIIHNAYSNESPTNFPLAPGRLDRRYWEAAEQGNWYDVTISASNFIRRFGGRVENGDHLISDPAMGT